VSQPEGGGPDLASLLGLGVALAAYLVAGLGLGWLADKAMDSLPICTLIGLALGIIAACVHVYAQFKTFFKE
jgi:F0F1-type ATP synthase assembly protein I